MIKKYNWTFTQFETNEEDLLVKTFKCIDHYKAVTSSHNYLSFFFFFFLLGLVFE